MIFGEVRSSISLHVSRKQKLRRAFVTWQLHQHSHLFFSSTFQLGKFSKSIFDELSHTNLAAWKELNIFKSPFVVCCPHNRHYSIIHWSVVYTLAGYVTQKLVFDVCSYSCVWSWVSVREKRWRWERGRRVTLLSRMLSNHSGTLSNSPLKFPLTNKELSV